MDKVYLVYQNEEEANGKYVFSTRKKAEAFKKELVMTYDEFGDTLIKIVELGVDEAEKMKARTCWSLNVLLDSHKMTRVTKYIQIGFREDPIIIEDYPFVYITSFKSEEDAIRLANERLSMSKHKA